MNRDLIRILAGRDRRRIDTRSGVMHTVDSFQPVALNMRIQFRGIQVGMSEQELYGTQIRPTFQQMRCKRMPKRMG